LNYIYVGIGAAICGVIRVWLSDYTYKIRIPTSKRLRLQEDLSLTIEIVDKIERIENFLPKLINFS
jgi:PII-like signaling protein